MILPSGPGTSASALRIGFEADNWALTAWGRNITDERYLEEVIPAPEFGGSFLHQARGAAYGVDLKYSFE